MRILHIATALACATLLGACGIKGSLYLPEPATQTHAVPGADHDNKGGNTPSSPQ